MQPNKFALRFFSLPRVNLVGCAIGRTNFSATNSPATNSPATSSPWTFAVGQFAALRLSGVSAVQQSNNRAADQIHAWKRKKSQCEFVRLHKEIPCVARNQNVSFSLHQEHNSTGRYRFPYTRSTIPPECVVFFPPGAQVSFVQPHKLALRFFSLPRVKLVGRTIGFGTIRRGADRRGAVRRKPAVRPTNRLSDLPTVRPTDRPSVLPPFMISS